MARRPLIVPERIDDGRTDFASLALAFKDRTDAYQAWAAQLAQPDRIEVEAIMAERYSVGWRADPCTFANHLDPTYELWPYVRLISDALKSLVLGDTRRLIVNMPSRYGKSLALCWFLVWLFDRIPTSKSIYSCYGDDLANEHAVFIRDRLREHQAELRTQLRVDRQRMDRFVTKHGGGLLAAGIDSGIIGFGAGGGGGVICDDPLKNWQEAHSKGKRDHVWNQFRSVLHTRLNDDDAWMCVVHHRMHEDDLTGRLVEMMENETGELWTHLVIPAIAEAGRADPLDREPGEVIEPRRFSKVHVLDLHRGLGTYLASAMEQQAPAPEEGGELKRAWWHLDTELPTTFDDALSSWDMKLKDKETGDYVVGQVWGRVGSHFFMLDQVRGQWSQAVTAVAMCLVALRWPDVGKHVVENAGYGPEVMAELRRTHPGWTCSDDMAGTLGITDDERPGVEKIMRAGLSGILKETPKGSKTVRMRAYSGRIEAGDVHLDARGRWLAGFLDETSAFPDGTHDDQVDACSQALKRLATAPAVAATSSRRLPAAATAKGQALTSRRSLGRVGRPQGSRVQRPRPR